MRTLEFIKKHNYIWILNIIYTFVLIMILINSVYGESAVILSIYYGESHNTNDYAQIYYAANINDMDEDRSIKSHIVGNEADLYIKMKISSYKENIFRLDPINTDTSYSIRKIVISNAENHKLCEISGKQLLKYCSAWYNAEYKCEDEYLCTVDTTSENLLVLSSDFSDLIADELVDNNLNFFRVALVIYILLGIFQIFISKKKEPIKKKWYNYLYLIGTIVLSCMGGALVYGNNYLIKNFDDVPLGQIIYHLHTPLDGTNTASFSNIITNILLICSVILIIIVSGNRVLRRSGKSQIFLTWVMCGGIIAIAYVVVLVSFHFEFVSYIKYVNEKTKLYENNYVDGRDVELTFPKEKRNLIYIFCESMEISYADKSVGGAMDENYIPELTEISLENENFGIYGQLNGAYTMPGSTFTMGGLVSQTSGVPINENIVSNDTLNSNWQSENNYVPGVYAIGDILEEQGYNQEFLIGSDGKFAGRSSYFKGHGDYTVFDYYTAIDKGYISDDYKVWWGYEDEKLFKYAKTELDKLASEKDPFNLTILTVDTHFPDGYVCEQCDSTYDDQYSNVIACSSKQIAELIEWIEQQDFFENTTIVIAGDHLTMDSSYVERHDIDNYNRRTYFTIINGKAINEKPSINRMYTTLDLYPTTLAAMGVQIEGNHLGLGTNLYSGEPTLIEQYGKDYLEVELLKDSKFYRKNLLYAN